MIAVTSKRSLARSGLVVGAATALGTALTVPFHLVMVRIFTPAQYSLLASLFAILLVSAVPTMALQATVAREVAQLLAEGREDEVGRYLRDGLRTVLGWLVVLALAGFAVALPLALALNVRDPLPVGATAAALALTLPLPVLWGGLQGAERFDTLAGAQLSYFVLRLGAGVALAALGAGVGGVMVGVAVATGGTTLLSVLPLRELFARSRRVVHRRGRRFLTGYAGAAAVGLGFLAALTNSDLLAARVSFHPSIAGAYAGASLGARSLLLVPVAVTTVLFPRVATLRDRARERPHLLAGLLAVGAIGLLATAIFSIFPGPIIRIALGAKYLSAKSWLGPLSLAMALYAVGNVYLFHFLSIGRARFAAVVPALFALQLLCFAAFHRRPGELVAIQIGVAAALVVAGEGYYRLTASHGART